MKKIFCSLVIAMTTFNCFGQAKMERCKGTDREKWTNCFNDFSPEKGEKFVGIFMDGKYFRGLYEFRNGQRYTGRINKDGEWHGLGVYAFPSGEMYSGLWQNGKLTSQGVHVLAGEKISMIKVINACETRNAEEFIESSRCIKLSYWHAGESPKSQDAKNFYLLLDGVVEDFKKANLGLAKAKAEIIKAWQSTIDASNKNEQAKSNNAEQLNQLDNMAEQLNQLDFQRKLDAIKRFQDSVKPCYPASNGTRICP